MIIVLLVNRNLVVKYALIFLETAVAAVVIIVLLVNRNLLPKYALIFLETAVAAVAAAVAASALRRFITFPMSCVSNINITHVYNLMGNIPSNHQRIWSDLTKIENDTIKLQMLETLLAVPEYVTSFKKINIYADLKSWAIAKKRGAWADWPTFRSPASQQQPQASSSLINAPTRRAIDYLNEAYEILGIPDGEPLSLAMLKSAYKKKSMLHHPDKGGDPIMFDSLTKAYLYLQEVYNKLIPKAGRDHADSTPVTMEAAKARRNDNTIEVYEEQDDIALVVHEPKAVGPVKKVHTHKQAPAPASNPSTRPIAINPKQLDMNVFNQLFEQNKLPDPEKDDGYGDWLSGQDEQVKRNTKGLRGKFNIEVFNKTFEDDTKEFNNSKQTQISKYNSPDALMLTPNAVILGGEKPAEYTAPAGSNIQYTDLKAAYSTRMTFSQEIKDVRINDKSFEQAKAERENSPGPLSPDELRHVEELGRQTEAAEKQRKMRLAAKDTDTSMYHDRLKSRLLITAKPLQ